MQKKIVYSFFCCLFYVGKNWKGIFCHQYQHAVDPCTTKSTTEALLMYHNPYWSVQKIINRQMLRFCFQYNYKNNANILFQFKLLLFFLGGLVDKFKSAATETTAVSESNGFCGPDSFLIQNTNISLISISCSFHEFRSNHRKFIFFFAGNIVTGSISRRHREKCCQRPVKK